MKWRHSLPPITGKIPLRNIWIYILIHWQFLNQSYPESTSSMAWWFSNNPHLHHACIKIIFPKWNCIHFIYKTAMGVNLMAFISSRKLENLSLKSYKSLWCYVDYHLVRNAFISPNINTVEPFANGRMWKINFQKIVIPKKRLL